MKVVWLAVHKGPGDHQMPIIEVEYNDCMGENIHKIVRPPARKLACCIKKSLNKYNTMLERFFSDHDRFSPYLMRYTEGLQQFYLQLSNKVYNSSISSSATKHGILRKVERGRN